MPKRYNISWRENDVKTVERAIKNFNAKIYRQRKANPNAEYLPQPIKKSEAVASIQTRNDLNKFVRSLQRFSKRGSEKPVEIAPDVHVTEWENQEVKYTIRNFNAKITRLSKYIDPSILPEKISYKKATQIIENKSDVKWVKEQHEKFLKPDAEKRVQSTKGHIMTEWEVEHLKEEQRKANEIKQRERSKIGEAPVKVGGEEQDVTRAAMGSVKENSLKETERDPLKMTEKEFELFRKNLDATLDRQLRGERKEQMRQNYIKGLTEAGFLDADPDLISYIEAIDIDTFVETAETDDTATFTWYKDPQAFDTRLEYIQRSWKMAFYGQSKLWGVV